MKKFYTLLINFKNLNNGGETGIRTQERVAPLSVFKTDAFNRSAISPYVLLMLSMVEISDLVFLP